MSGHGDYGSAGEASPRRPVQRCSASADAGSWNSEVQAYEGLGCDDLTPGVRTA